MQDGLEPKHARCMLKIQAIDLTRKSSVTGGSRSSDNALQSFFGNASFEFGIGSRIGVELIVHTIDVPALSTTSSVHLLSSSR